MLELYIKTRDQLEDLCSRIKNSPWVALDTEFMREKSYYPKLCLLQLCNAELAAIVDPQALEDLEPLLGILHDQSMVKVFHAGRQDLEIFHCIWNKLPKPIFDTQLAATLLGYGEQIGYANLVHKLLQKTLDKVQTRTDWARRPLASEQLRYALDDVIYLAQIYQILQQQLQHQGRENWLQEDFYYLVDPETYSVDPSREWQRVKGQQRLKGVELAVLQVLAAWREREAQKLDRPRRWILKDQLMLDISRRRPKQKQQLEKIRGVETRVIKRWGEEILHLVEAGLALPKEAWPRVKRPSPRLSLKQEAMADLLMCALRLIAEEQKVSPTALSSKSDVARLVNGERDLAVLHGWRRALAGDKLLEVMAGRSSVMITDSGLSLVRG